MLSSELTRLLCGARQQGILRVSHGFTLGGRRGASSRNHLRTHSTVCAVQTRFSSAAADLVDVALPETISVSFDDIKTRQMGLRLQDKLLQEGKEVMGVQEFMQNAGDEGLTRQQAEQLLEDLFESGGVHTDGEVVHLFPAKIYRAVNAKLDLPAVDPCPDLTKRISELEAEFAVLDEVKTRADEEVGRRRLTFWAAVAKGSALQMAVFSFFTFPALSGSLCVGWDVVEPICFFVMQAYIVGWFAYFFSTRREHSLLSFDERRLYAMSLEAYKRRKVNITRWAEVRDELAELNARRALYTTRVV